MAKNNSLSMVGKHVNANLLEGTTVMTGKIYFYEDGFVFKAQSVNGILRMPKVCYQEIVAVEERRTLGIIPNGLSIKLSGDRCLAFAVSCRNDVMRFLKFTIDSLKT